MVDIHIILKIYIKQNKTTQQQYFGEVMENKGMAPIVLTVHY